MELALSNDLKTIAAEIRGYKNLAGDALMEMGRRLAHVKEHDLVHGQFGRWVEEECGLDIYMASKMMRVYREFGNLAPAPNLEASKIFEILSLPETVDKRGFLEQTHVVPSTGELKTVDEMTRKELREVKAKLKEAEERLKAKPVESEELEATRAKLKETENLLLQARTTLPPELEANIRAEELARFEREKARIEAETAKKDERLRVLEVLASTEELENEKKALRKELLDLKESIADKLEAERKLKAAFNEEEFRFKKASEFMSILGNGLGPLLRAKGDLEALAPDTTFHRSHMKLLRSKLDRAYELLELVEETMRTVNVSDIL